MTHPLVTEAHRLVGNKDILVSPTEWRRVVSGLLALLARKQDAPEQSPQAGC